MTGFIHQHFPERITLADIAAAGTMSRSQCCIVFREYVNRTPNEYLTDYRIEQIENAVVPYLSDDDWAEAASEYLSMCADTLDFYAEHGEPLDVDNDTSGWPILLLIVIGVPMIIAGIVCGVLYSQMKTARLKTEANDYIGAGLKLLVQVDNYTHTDRVQVYDPPHEESSSSGGSSVDSDGFGGSSGGSF